MIVLSQEAEIARENGSCSVVSGCLCHTLDGRPVLHAMLFKYLESLITYTERLWFALARGSFYNSA